MGRNSAEIDRLIAEWEAKHDKDGPDWDYYALVISFGEDGSRDKNAGPIHASPLRYALVTALTGPRKLVSPEPGCRANISAEASPEP